MKTQFVLSLVLGVLISASSAHEHGMRKRHRLNDPAKRIYIEQNSIAPQNLYTRTNSSSSSSSNLTSTSLPKAPSSEVTTISKPIPKPLDLSISPSNLSGGCLTYLTSLLSSEDLQDCLPLALLLTTSSAYSSLLSSSIQSGNYTKINNLISYTSSSAREKCDEYFTSIQSSLSSNKNCGTDLSNKNQVVKDTDIAIGNYQLIKEASKLTDKETGVYCYIESMAATRPDDAYLWSLPSGIPLPSKSIPTCSSCSKSLLNTYMSFIPDTSTLNSTIVKSAITRVNDACGQGFVNLSAIAVSGTSSSSMIKSIPPYKSYALSGVILSIFRLMFM
ncbi:hypothetical protein L486_00371 [Kwoniella mangroviensis CBS 10435]|uniref:DUF7729 domain-containing protein n=1 Tax=Kwoniella mangroviensis CBS 10435 TaxID=1331196 RepID=A0A1B9IZ00_9TREE|nr:hypothetical protein L486_00371 [Kwoniella mangroviensis CBS 10435]